MSRRRRRRKTTTTTTTTTKRAFLYILGLPPLPLQIPMKNGSMRNTNCNTIHDCWSTTTDSISLPPHFLTHSLTHSLTRST
jgi:hypothetical protein